jgi:hypothetical protein
MDHSQSEKPGISLIFEAWSWSMLVYAVIAQFFHYPLLCLIAWRADYWNYFNRNPRSVWLSVRGLTRGLRNMPMNEISLSTCSLDLSNNTLRVNCPIWLAYHPMMTMVSTPDRFNTHSLGRLTRSYLIVWLQSHLPIRYPCHPLLLSNHPALLVVGRD